MNKRFFNHELIKDLKSGKLDGCTYEGSKITLNDDNWDIEQIWMIDFFHKKQFVESYMYNSEREYKNDFDLIKLNIANEYKMNI